MTRAKDLAPMTKETEDSVPRFEDERVAFEDELTAYYDKPVLDISAWEHELHEESRAHPGWSPFRRKVLGYRFMAENCPVHVFRHCPFAFEINTGRTRRDLGTGGLGGWLKREPFGRRLRESSNAWWIPCRESGLSTGWPVLDDNHHTIGYGKVLQHGLRGLIRQAESHLSEVTTPAERDFLEAAVEGNRALIRIAGRLADDARASAALEPDATLRRRLEDVADMVSRVPAAPATTLYEALNTLLFIFHVVQSIEGNGISVFGHVDRLLIPYYEADVQSGRLNEAQARDLIGRFLAVSDVRYGMRSDNPPPAGTNGTVTLGGCDRDGTAVFNPLTRMLLEAHRDLGLIDPKINARISAAHPPACFELLAECIVAPDNTLSVFNDDVVIPANARMGKAVEDCRVYVGGGCQENVLEECEINSRATIYLNLLSVFLSGFFPEKWRWFFGRAGTAPVRYEECASWEELYGAFLRNLKIVVDAHIDERNRTEREGWRYNPCPLHSSMLDDCLAQRKDMMAGGCRYSFGSVSLAGIGTLVDSLLAVKILVFDQGEISLSELRRMLETDFEGAEAFRERLANRVAKFGHEDPSISEFSAQVFADVARVTSGKPNSRGGCYEPSLFSFRSFVKLGEKTGATPDGRRDGHYLSPGMSPSVLALGQHASVGQVLSSLEPLNMKDYPVVAVLDLKLPATPGGLPSSALVAVLRRFLASGGSVLQINCVSQDTLTEARAHPERHPDLVVRVSGYSSVFVRLPEAIQDEIIDRTEADV
jgi:formate C-acetyltransferase